MDSGQVTAPSQDSQDLTRIHDALRLSYDPRTANDTRQSALQFLNNLKARPEAPQHGFALASDARQEPFARHFGLSLLQSSINYHWEEHNEEQVETLRNWILSLAFDITQRDPAYFRNKIAYLWGEIAKRTWAGQWMSMDELLVSAWENHDTSRAIIYRELVLCVLETLSDDVCNREDPVASLRQEILGQALNEIIIPQNLYKRHVDSHDDQQDGESFHNVRATHDGWLARMCTFLSELRSSTGDSAVSSTLKILEALKPTVKWISLDAIVETGCIDSLFDTLTSNEVLVQTVFQ